MDYGNEKIDHVMGMDNGYGYSHHKSKSFLFVASVEVVAMTLATFSTYGRSNNELVGDCNCFMTMFTLNGIYKILEILAICNALKCLHQLTTKFIY